MLLATVLPYRCIGNVSGKVKTRPAPERQRLRKRNDKGQEEMEMKGMVTSAEPDDDYYFEDPSNIGTYTSTHCQTTHWLIFWCSNWT